MYIYVCMCVPGSSGPLVQLVGESGEPWEGVEPDGDRVTGPSPFTEVGLSLDMSASAQLQREWVCLPLFTTGRFPMAIQTTA